MCKNNVLYFPVCEQNFTLILISLSSSLLEELDLDGCKLVFYLLYTTRLNRVSPHEGLLFIAFSLRVLSCRVVPFLLAFSVTYLMCLIHISGSDDWAEFRR